MTEQTLPDDVSVLRLRLLQAEEQVNNLINMACQEGARKGMRDLIDDIYRQRREATPLSWAQLAPMLFDIGRRYWNAAVAERGAGAVQYVRNNDSGEMVLYTRGEYSEELQKFVMDLPESQEHADA